MVGSGQRQDAEEEVFGEVAAAHVRDFMSEDGIDFFGAEVVEESGREEHGLAADADGGRAGDGG